MATSTLPGTVDPAVLQRVLDGRWADVRELCRQNFRFAPALPRFHTDLDTYRAKITADLRELAATGRARLGFPKEYGGTDEVGGASVLFEMLGFGDLSLLVKVGVQWGLFGAAVQNLGTRMHHERYLRSIMTLALPGCFAMTETAHGSDVHGIRTTATYEPVSQQFVVHTPDRGARKDYVGNAARDGRMAVVFAQLIVDGTNHGVHALVVPIRDDHNRPLPGVRIEDCGLMGGLHGVDHGRLSFDHVRVPREALLNRFGEVAPNGRYTSSIDDPRRRFYAMLSTLVRSRISIAGGAGSAAKTALTIAIRYAMTRRQFVRPDTGEEIPLLDYPLHQRRLLPALATTYALHFTQEDVLAELHDVELHPDVIAPQRQRVLESRGAGLKAVGTWHARRTIEECRESCGGAGYLAENRLPQLKADIEVFPTFEGDNTVLMQLVARGLLAGIDVLPAPADRPPVDPRSRAWQRAAFADRDRHVLDGLVRRLARAVHRGDDPLGVFTAAQQHAVTAARAHTDRLVLTSFADAVDRCADPAVAALLDRVCDLHALSVIEADRAWFLEHGRLTPAESRQVTAAVTELCRELRPHAGTLVEAFAIPPHWLDVPIAHARHR